MGKSEKGGSCGQGSLGGDSALDELLVSQVREGSFY